MEHRPDNEYGENLYLGWSSNPKFRMVGSAPVENWYSEIKDYTYGFEPKSVDEVKDIGKSHYHVNLICSFLPEIQGKTENMKINMVKGINCSLF